MSLNLLVYKIKTIAALHLVIGRIKSINTCKCHVSNSYNTHMSLRTTISTLYVQLILSIFCYPLSYRLHKFLFFQLFILLNFQDPWANFAPFGFSDVVTIFIAGILQTKPSQRMCTSV